MKSEEEIRQLLAGVTVHGNPDLVNTEALIADVLRWVLELPLVNPWAQLNVERAIARCKDIVK